MKFIKLILALLCLFPHLFGCMKKDYTFTCENEKENGCILEVWCADSMGFPIDGIEYNSMKLVYGQEKTIKFPEDEHYSTIVYLKTPVTLQGDWQYDIVKVTLYSDGTYEEIEVKEVPIDYFSRIDSLSSSSY